MNYDLKLILDGRRLYPSKYVKYLGILIDPYLTWNYHIKSLAPKLARAAGMLAKLRHFVPHESLRNIYFGIFASIMNNGSQIWGLSKPTRLTSSQTSKHSNKNYEFCKISGTLLKALPKISNSQIPR